MQRAAGNQATGALLQRQPTGHKGAKDKAGDEAGADALRSAFITDRDTFINLWLAAAVAALEGAPEPKDPESKRNFWVALAGNLLWAATSLVAPECLFAIRIMSFSGAAVGSGILSQEPEQAPSGRETVSQLLTTTRDLMITTAGPWLDRSVAECISRQVTDREEQREVLWRNLFKTPYNESEPIRAEMSVKVKEALRQFLAQWHAWKDAIQKEAEDRGYTSGLPPDVYGIPEFVAEYRKDPKRAWMLVQDPVSRVAALSLALEKERPFTPNLTFETSAP